MADALKTVHIGLGTIGLEILKAGARANLCEPVAGADISPEIADRSLRIVAQDEDLPDLTICASLDDALDAADRLDAVAIANEVALLGAGVNPGFVLDLFPFVMTRVCQRVDSVQAGRFVNASRRRRQLQAKIGSGMHPDDFRELASQGKIGHVGLAESAALLADSLGWPWEEFEETIDPVIAEEPISTDHFDVVEGQVRGQHQTLKMGDVRLELIMALGEDERDEVRIEGVPPVHAVVQGGIHGDSATARAVINFMWPLVEAEPGLRTVTEVPPA
jgi:4-hydroxy-tetrahydrodipicolinate reductase